MCYTLTGLKTGNTCNAIQCNSPVINTAYVSDREVLNQLYGQFLCVVLLLYWAELYCEVLLIFLLLHIYKGAGQNSRNTIKYKTVKYNISTKCNLKIYHSFESRKTNEASVKNAFSLFHTGVIIQGFLNINKKNMYLSLSHTKWCKQNKIFKMKISVCSLVQRVKRK